MVDYRIDYGQDFNYYKKVTVSNTTFGIVDNGYSPDVIIPFTTQSVIFLNEDDADVVEYSFNGFDVHGELSPILPSRGLTFDNRVICKIWFRVKSGSAGPITVRVDAWAVR
jgi:hypothetical protein